MKHIARARSSAALLVTICLLIAPISVLAKKGEKNYKRGLEHEAAQQWEKAAQEFALAVAALPSDIEYQLHYRRAIFNASQSFMQKGRALSEQGDYVGAYNAFRQAYGYDQVNELAHSEMERMLRLQREKEGDGGDRRGGGGGATDSRISPTSFSVARQNGGNGTAGRTPRSAAGGAIASVPQDVLPPAEPRRIINYSGKLEPFIRTLAEELNLNVIFDRDFQQVGNREVTYRMRDVTTARALDHIFKSQGLFFQKLDRRTILVADQAKRPQYQELVLRTFYLSNVDPTEAKNAIMQSLPAQARPGSSIYANKNTNSLTVRDTPETIRTIGELLKSIDKDRAAVVMDINIYEISRADLQRLGGQLGTASTLGNLGGSSALAIGAGGSRQVAQQAIMGAAPTALGAAILVPPFILSALQSTNNTRLVSSTQLHAFDGEASSTSVGRRVPIQTGVAPSYNFGNQTGGTNNQPGANLGIFGSSGYPIIQYEQTGLDLKFTPQVFPNHDVQVKMEIKSAEVEGTAGSANLTPVFTNRTITGTARVQNNRTMMLASVAQDKQSSGREGIPLLGLIPVIGRIFSTPRRDNSQSDIVITVTPRVLRAPDITPRDEELRPSGSMQMPHAETLEAVVRDADREDQLAAIARQQQQQQQSPQQPASQRAQLPVPEETPAFVPAPQILMNNAGATPAPAANNNSSSSGGVKALPAVSINSTEAPPPPQQLSTAKATTASAITAVAAPPATKLESIAELRLVPESQEVRVGEKRRFMLAMKTDAPLGMATATLRFDPRVAAVRSVTKGMMFDRRAAPVIMQSIDPQQGVLLLSIAPAAGAAAPLTGEGVLLIIEIEGLAPGESAIVLDTNKVHFAAADGRTVQTQVAQGKMKVTR